MRHVNNSLMLHDVVNFKITRRNNGNVTHGLVSEIEILQQDPDGNTKLHTTITLFHDESIVG